MWVCTSVYYRYQVQLMSFQEDERETLAMLEDVLAFIDAFDQPRERDAALKDDGMSLQCKTSASGTSRPKKIAHRERVKAEIQQLRHEAAVLELWLERLETNCSPAAENARSSAAAWSASAWMDILVQEFQRRKRSEATNRKLKAMPQLSCCIT